MSAEHTILHLNDIVAGELNLDVITAQQTTNSTTLKSD